VYVPVGIDNMINKCDYGEFYRRVLDAFKKTVAQEENIRGRTLLEIERCVLAENVTKKYCVRHPILLIKHALKSMLRTCYTLHSETIIFFDQGKVVQNGEGIWEKMKMYVYAKLSSRALNGIIFFELLTLLLIFLGFLGFCIISLWRKPLFCLLAKSMPFIGMFIFITLASGCARLRMPVEPFLIIFATYFWATLFKRKKGVT